MSFYGTLEDAKAAIHSVESSEDVGHAKGKGSSKLLHGESHPGVHNKPAGEEQRVGRLRSGIKSPKTRTGKLTRKYAAS